MASLSIFWCTVSGMDKNAATHQYMLEVAVSPSANIQREERIIPLNVHQQNPSEPESNQKQRRTSIIQNRLKNDFKKDTTLSFIQEQTYGEEKSSNDIVMDVSAQGDILLQEQFIGALKSMIPGGGNKKTEVGPDGKPKEKKGLMGAVFAKFKPLAAVIPGAEGCDDMLCLVKKIAGMWSGLANKMKFGSHQEFGVKDYPYTCLCNAEGNCMETTSSVDSFKGRCYANANRLPDEGGQNNASPNFPATLGFCFMFGGLVLGILIKCISPEVPPQLLDKKFMAPSDDEDEIIEEAAEEDLFS